MDLYFYHRLNSNNYDRSYSSDLLLRQYKRIRLELGKAFTYKEIQKVYTIVLFEKSSAAFHKFSDEIYIHHFEQKSDTGMEMDLLQEYTFICLDIFNSVIHNEGREIENRLEEWLVFLSQDDPNMIIKLLNRDPVFQRIYEEVYTICLNTERMMNMFSKELEILDRNTVKLMVDEMIEEHAQQMEEIAEERKQLKADAEKIKADAEKTKADAEKTKADAEKTKADAEKALAVQKERADAAEDEVKRLKKQLEKLQKL